jgi:hypothetical protein
MSYENIIRSLEVAQAEVIKFANSKGRDIHELEKESAAQLARIQQLEAENAALRKTEKQALSTVQLEHPFPNGFTAKVIPCSTPEKAGQNVAFYNPGFRFEEGHVFVYPDDCSPSVSAAAALRLVYCPTTPDGYIEMGKFQRLYFGLTLDAAPRKFLPAGAIPEITSCKIRVSRIDGRPGVVSVRGEDWAHLLDGMVGVVDCPLVVNHLDTYRVIYRVTPQDMWPVGAGIFTKDTKLAVVLEDERNIVC